METRTVLATCFMCGCLLRPCGAQEVEGNGKSGNSIFSVAPYVELSTPIATGVRVDSYGFYLGTIHAGIAILEVPMALGKHVVVAPSYLFIAVPASGLSLLTEQPASQSYKENQIRLAGTVQTVWHHFAIADRNMYVRRFTPQGEVNRYRNRIYVAHTVSLGSYKATPFVFDEVYHDVVPGPWVRRNWFVAAVDMPMTRHLTLQPSYIRQDDQFLRSVNFLGLGLIVKTGRSS